MAPSETSSEHKTFAEHRRVALSGLDLSPKGSFDRPILGLLECINGSTKFFTTSSCSGRIAVFQYGDKKSSGSSEQKAGGAEGGSEHVTKGGRWLVAKHAPLFIDELADLLDQSGLRFDDNDASVSNDPIEYTERGLVYLKHEPLILHVECRTADDAQELLAVARACGFRESGLSIGRSRIMVAIRTTSLRLDVPIACAGKLLVSRAYVAFLLDAANRMFEQNRRRTESFYEQFIARFGRGDGADADPHGASEPSTEPNGNVYALVAAQSLAFKTKQALDELSWREKSLRVGRAKFLPDKTVYIPLSHNGWERVRSATSAVSMESDTMYELDLAVLPQEFSEVLGCIVVPVEDMGGSSKMMTTKQKKKKSRGNRQTKQTTTLLAAICASSRKDLSVDHIDALRRVTPRRWTIVGDVALFPQDSFDSPEFDQFEVNRKRDSALWTSVAKSLRVRRVGIQRPVDSGIMRQSRVDMRLGDDGWVRHRENGVIYEFDVTRVMFSRGNVTERTRMGCPGLAKDEVVIDLYCGIGYFTLPLLCHGGAAHVHACEINPDSIEALRRSASANGVLSRLTIHEGDNEASVRERLTHRSADRVLCGLLPTSEASWPLAVRLLSDNGGHVHVHENVDERELSTWVERLLVEFRRRFAQDRENGAQWTIEVEHLERVKWYAPHIRHVVVDLICSPPKDT